LIFLLGFHRRELTGNPIPKGNHIPTFYISKM